MRIRKKLGELLVNAGLLTEDQLGQALDGQKKAGLKLGQYLIQEGWVREDQIIDQISKQLNVEKYIPEKYPIDQDLASLVPFDIAQKYQVTPLKKKRNLLTIAMADPMDIDAIDSMEVLTNMEVTPVVCSEKEINQLLTLTYGTQAGGLQQILDGVEEVEVDVEEEASSIKADVRVSSLQDMAEEAPVVRIVNSIIAQAVREGASDIHISPEADSAQLRFRIDGKLREVPSPPKSLMLPIVSRVKILSNMDIAVSRVPQDGRFTVKMEKREINIRASALPTIHGENIVLRLLDMSSGVYSLKQLGMSDADREKIESAIVKPYGMILSTGPTGSGKSTSLYAILRELNTPDINIITLEDPVEYRVSHIRQVQLNRKAGMTFASGLRSMLRQDPDVMLVGEIRDSETAGLAIQAALTGHRVLSTLHTNDSAGAVTRLTEMGIEPFLTSSVLLVSFAQRLIRTVCPYCKEPYTPSMDALKAWGLDKVENADFQHGRGCAQCMNTGYKGRTGVFEVLQIDEEIQGMILKGKTAQEIIQRTKKAGKLRTLKDDAADKVVRGITTLEEAASTVMLV
ncbi:MAG: Flp pilus assembly complex ATPase component TadA [Syntrophobacterales bacterium]|nr:Flp pilus assembly complex ATPase component TadA [Syntrophobacterales bacterium]